MDRVEKLALEFCKGKYNCDIEDKFWLKIFDYLRKNASILAFDREAIHLLWTINGGHLRRKIKDDNLVLDILLKFFPKYKGEGLIVYRGECKFLFEDNKIGFCWTPKEEVARMFARGLNSIESGGILLKAFAPQQAIISSPNKHSVNTMEEYEYTCNPLFLENIEVVRAYEKNR